MNLNITEMAKELVLAQVSMGNIPPETMNALLVKICGTLTQLERLESPTSPAIPAVQAAGEMDWRKSITKHSVRCLECGQSFRQLSSRHLGKHGLDSQTYRAKYGIPNTQSLSSRQATARRQELAKAIRPWEQAAKKRKSKQKKAAGKSG